MASSCNPFLFPVKTHTSRYKIAWLKPAQKKVRRPLGCSGQTAVIEGVYNLYTKPQAHLQQKSNKF